MISKDELEKGVKLVVEERERLATQLGVSYDEALRILEVASNYAKADAINNLDSHLNSGLTIYNNRM